MHDTSYSGYEAIGPAALVTFSRLWLPVGFNSNYCPLQGKSDAIVDVIEKEDPGRMFCDGRVFSK